MELRNNGLLEKHVVDVLKEKKLTITTAESCTGGMISSRIVNVPGASAVLKQAYVTYCDEAKHTVLGVKKETLEKYYAVSSQTACEMAEGGAKAAGADVCVSVTGVAGPDTEDGKPVGCVFIGCFYNGNVTVKCTTKWVDYPVLLAVFITEMLLLRNIHLKETVWKYVHRQQMRL